MIRGENKRAGTTACGDARHQPRPRTPLRTPHIHLHEAQPTRGPPHTCIVLDPARQFATRQQSSSRPKRPSKLVWLCIDRSQDDSNIEGYTVLVISYKLQCTVLSMRRNMLLVVRHAISSSGELLWNISGAVWSSSECNLPLRGHRAT